MSNPTKQPPPWAPSRRAMIQNFTGATNTTYYWGYGARIVPCSSDAGACAYFDACYDGHVMSMLFSGVFWASVVGLLIVWAVARQCLRPSTIPVLGGLGKGGETTTTAIPTPQQPQSTTTTITSLSRLRRALAASSRRLLLPEPSTPILRRLFGHTTRLQILVLALLASYLAIFTFAGLIYGIWFSPVKNAPAGTYSTRSTLGPFADRVGVLAYALTPLLVALASRESLLSAVTGLPHTSFIFLHRWTGHLALAQSLAHTAGWCLVEGYFYKPQPRTWQSLVSETYIAWGFAGLAALVLLWALALPAVVRRVTGHEVFRKAHYALACLYMGCLVAHWRLLQCFVVPGLALWGADRLARLARSWMLHRGVAGARGFVPARARCRLWEHPRDGDLVRLDFEHPVGGWSVGQHFYLCFAEASIWQSHPFTPLSLPDQGGVGGPLRHSYVIRARKGETRRLAELVKAKIAAAAAEEAHDEVTTPVILQGPYGAPITEDGSITPTTNVLCLAGGTGIAFVLPVLLQLVASVWKGPSDRKIELVWAVRRRQDIEWVRPELDVLRAAAADNIAVRVFVTGDDSSSSSSSPPSTSATETPLPLHEEEKKPAQEKVHERVGGGGGEESATCAGRPDIDRVVGDFLDKVARGPTTVFGSGPAGMMRKMREVVARCNSGSRVWKGEERSDVRLVCDDRLE